MSGRLTVAIVGAGNLAQALAPALRKAGYRVETILTRSSGASLAKARSLARKVGASATRLSGVRLDEQLVWFCVPDSQIARAATALAGVTEWKGRVALHSSGALASDELRLLRKRGAAVASVHPLMTFVRASQPALVGVPFAIEGDAAAVRMARRVVANLGGTTYTIRKQDKAAYHAWGTFASPLLTAFLATTEGVAALAGVARDGARTRMLSILQQTLINYSRLGARESFSGPIVRGDVETVKRHLRVLEKNAAARDVYRALARAALLYLPVKNRGSLERVLRKI